MYIIYIIYIYIIYILYIHISHIYYICIKLYSHTFIFKSSFLRHETLYTNMGGTFQLQLLRKKDSNLINQI